MLIDYFVTAYLTIIGLFRNRKYENYEKYLLASLITADLIIFFSFIIVFPQAQLFVHQCSIITTNLGALVYLLHRTTAHTRKAQILRIIETLRSDKPYFDETRVKMNENIHLWEHFYPLVARVVCVLSIGTIMPFVLLLHNKDLDYNDPAAYVFPYLYHFEDIHTFWGFLVLQMLQGLTTLYLATNYFSFIGFVNCVLSNITAHSTELNLQLDNLISGFSKHPDLVLKNEGNENLLVDRFINIIKYQLYIQMYIKDFSSFLDFTLSYYILQFVSLAFGFTILGAEMFESNAGTLIQNMSLIITVMYGMYIWCNVSENISQMNEALLGSLYQTQWYKLPIKIRKLMIITMQHTQRPTIIRAFGIFIINFGLEIQILKVIYSMVNLLLFT